MPAHECSKPIAIIVPFGPNYLWHVLAVARIGYDSDYAERYLHTIAAEDRACLQKNEKLLSFGYGEGGALSGFFTALPSWLGLETENDFAAYFDALDTAFQRGSLIPFVEAFTAADWTDPFMAEVLTRPDLPSDVIVLRETAMRLGDVYLRHLGRYQRDVWPHAAAAMRIRMDELNGYFCRRDIIAEWERLLGIRFAADRYRICLCYANKNGPDYNSLGYSANLFYYDKPLPQTIHFLSHEVGTHLLIGLYYDLAWANTYEHQQLYSAYECLAMFYNRLIMGGETLAYTLPRMNDRRHLEIYAAAYVKGIKPAELLQAALQARPHP